MAKHKASTKLPLTLRNLDLHPQFYLAGQGNKDDVCLICLEKCAVGKCSAWIQVCEIAPPSLKFTVLKVSVFIEFSLSFFFSTDENLPIFLKGQNKQNANHQITVKLHLIKHWNCMLHSSHVFVLLKWKITLTSTFYFKCISPPLQTLQLLMLRLWQWLWILITHSSDIITQSNLTSETVP